MTSENTAPVSERGGWVMVPRDLPARIRRQIDATRHYLIQTGIDGHFAEVLLSHYGDFAREIEKAASPAVEGLHPATVDLVQRFSVALSAKLRKAELKYGYDDGWAQPDWEDDCRRALGEHVLKGDPLDVAAYAAFCWHHGWSTAPARQIAALQGSEGGHAGKLESAPTGGAAHLLGGERRFEHELKTWPRYFDALVDATKTFEVRQNDRAFEVGDTLWLREYRPGFGEGVYTGRELRRRVTYILHGGEFGIAAGHVVMGLATLPEPPSPAKQAPEAPPFTAERSSPHEQNTPSTPPDTPEGVSEAEAAMKEIFAKHGPALREALRPFQTLPAIGDEVVEAIRQMILVEEAEQTRLRSMPSAYSWNKVAVVDGKLDVLRKLSALHQAGKLPAETDMALLRRLVDLTYGFAMEDQSVPSTKVALALIEQAQDDVRDGPKDGLTMKDRLHMRGVNYTPPPPATGGEG